MPSRRTRVVPPWRVLLAIALCAAPARSEVVERILAVVDGRPLTLSEVRLGERLRGLPRDAALQAAIDARLMFQEASRLPQAAVSAEEEDAALASLRQRLPAAADEPEPELRRLARREAVILKYVAFRFRPQVQVSDEALRAAWAAESPGAEAEFEAAAAALRERLTARALDARVEAWVAELRASASIRYNAPEPALGP